MASFPKSQYKLHVSLPQIIEGERGYYFGSTYCTKDLKPVDLLRSPPAENSPGNRVAFALRGKNLAINRASGSSGTMNTIGGTQSLSGFTDAMSRPFTSTSGNTQGRRFVIVSGTLCDLDENDSLIPRVVMVTGATRPTFVAGTIIGENPTSLVVMSVSREATTTTTVADNRRVTIGVVSKTDFSLALGFPEGNTSSANIFASNMRNVRYLGEVDGKHLVILTPSLNASNGLHRSSLFAFTVSDAKFFASAGGSDGILNHTTSNYNVYSTVSGLVPRTGSAGAIYTMRPGTTVADPVIFNRIIVPSEIAASGTTAPNLNSFARAAVTVNDMPDGVQLLPAVNLLNSSYGSSFAPYVTTGTDGKLYLNVISSFTGHADQESNSAVVIANVGLFTFEIDETGDVLTYRSHTLAGFGYGQRINEFLIDDSGRTLLLANTTGFAVWIWSDATQSYIKGEWRMVPAGLRRLSLDSAYKIWVEDQDGSVYLFDMDLSASVNITFDRASVTYLGTTVPIKANVEALSFAGNRIARSVRLVATGCTFDDGSVTKTVVTSATSLVEVPLFVNGGGNVSLNGYLL